MKPASTTVQLSSRSSLSALEAALELFRELRPEMAIQLPMVFLLIAQHRGISARLCQLTGLSQSAISRNLTALTNEGKRDEPELGLVVKTIDPTNPRAHAIHLTKEGRTLTAKLAEALASHAKARRDVEVRPEGDGTALVHVAARRVPEAFAGAHWEVWVD